MPAVPTRDQPNAKAGGFILWQRKTTEAELNRYW
jgi:hypothetical protein